MLILKRPIFNLGRRLEVCAQKVRHGRKIVDVGTDHAYLPIWLAKKGFISQAIALDVNESPLRSAKKNIEKYHVQDTVTTVLSDGLKQITSSQADDIIIAGMGGDLVIQIISQTPWLKDPRKRLILQPMSCENKVREYLNLEGFSNLDETALECDGKVYVVIVCTYTNSAPDKNILYPYVGKLLDNPSAITYKYLNRVLKHLRNKSLDPDAEKNISEIISKLEDVLANDNSQKYI